MNINVNRLSISGIFTRRIDNISAEIYQLEKRYWAAATEADARRIARAQNRLENKLAAIRAAAAEGRRLGCV